MIGQHGDRPVDLGPSHAPAPVFAGNEASLPVAGMAIGKIRRLAKDRYGAIRHPAQNALVGNIAEQQAIEIGKPHRPLGPAASFIKVFEFGIADDEVAEAFVADIEKGRLVLRHDGYPKLSA